MMNQDHSNEGVLTGSGFEAPPAIAPILREAAEAYADTEAAERALWRALALDADCLATHFSMYKFYFYKRRFCDAEEIALRALMAAARQGGFPADWAQLTRTSTNWRRVESPQHFYLFTLKALAFMRLRLGRSEEARAMLAKLEELDPSDSVGANVIRALAQ